MREGKVKKIEQWGRTHEQLDGLRVDAERAVEVRSGSDVLLGTYVSV